MKRKDLHNFIRTEIINELSETAQSATITSKSGVSKIINVDNADASTIDNIKKDPNVASATIGNTKLKEDDEDGAYELAVDNINNLPTPDFIKLIKYLDEYDIWTNDGKNEKKLNDIEFRKNTIDLGFEEGDVWRYKEAMDKLGLSKLNEMARTPNKLKTGEGFADAKEIYTGGLISRVLDLIEKAGDEGITQKELADALNIKSMPQINPLIRELAAIGAITIPKGIKAEPEAEVEPETEPETKETEVKPEDIEDLKDEDEEEVKDDYEKVDDEDTKGAEEFEKEPSAADIAAADKLAKAAAASKLSPEDEAKYEKLKTGIQNKLEKIKKLPKDKRTSSDDFKILKQLVGRDDVKKLFKAKGISLIDLIKV